METSTLVYVPDDESGWIPARLLNKDETYFIVQVEDEDDSRSCRIPVEKFPQGLPLQNQDLHEKGVEDMCLLSHLHEPAILFNLKTRFQHRFPYTFTDKIVIAINPYIWIEELYSETLKQSYLSTSERKLPPHVYATSALAYRNMITSGQAQSILVSGESGAGKTETVKICMDHFACASSLHNDGNSGTFDQEAAQLIIEKVLKSNPLLETFGNATTLRNNNSSRFGKFTQLQFNQHYQMIGANCRHYLLEKSRVVNFSSGERTYHIFYQLLAHAPDFPSLNGKSIKSFKYLSQPSDEHSDQLQEILTIDGQSDHVNFETTRDALTTIGVSEDTQQHLFQSIIGILYLGQIEFEQIDPNDIDSSRPQTPDAMTMPAELLGIASEQLADALCNRTVQARDEVYIVPLAVEQAINNRNALAKELYARLFSWLVDRINASINQSTRFDGKSGFHIDLLDIFGFENFQVNHFEQFCINFANEKLQQKFTQDVLKTVQQEYQEEKLEWQYIPFQDNQDILDLVEGRMGILALLDEECVRPKGNDTSFTSKILTTHENHPRVERTRMNPDQFILHHYAAAVVYDSDGFVEKNKDTLQEDVETLMQTSVNSLVSELFRSKATTPKAKRSTMKETVSSKFNSQLAHLLRDISATDVHYIRCLMPNRIKSPSVFEPLRVIQQLRCSGVIEAIQITRATFPNKLRHTKFLQRFILLKKSTSPIKKKQPGNFSPPKTGQTAKLACQELASSLFADPEGSFVLGKTQIYFRANALEELETRRTAFVREKHVLLQKQVRCFLARKRYVYILACIVRLQAWYKMQRRCREYGRKVRSAQIIQARWRGVLSRSFKKTLLHDRMVINLQALYRRHVAQSRYQRYRRAAIRIQALAKMRLQKKHYVVAQKEKQQQLQMENQLEVLNRRLEGERRAREESEERFSTLQRQMDEKVQDDRSGDSNMMDNAGVVAEDTRLLDESGKMLDYLRQELRKVREMNENLRKENETLKADNKHIKEAYTTAGASFAALNKLNKQQSKANLRLMSTHAALIKSQETKMKKYQKQITDLKEELRMQRNVYSSELMARVQQRDTLMDILHLAESHDVDEAVISKMREFMTETSRPRRQPSQTAESRRQSSTSGRDSASSSSTTNDSHHRSPPIRATVAGDSLTSAIEARESMKYAASRASSSAGYVDDETRNRKSRLGGMFKKMFKGEDK